MTRQSLRAREARVASQVVEDRQAAIEAMNPNLKRRFAQVEKRVNDLQEENLRYYHELGQLIQEIKADPDRYGRNAVKLIERALCTQARTLRDAANFAREFDNAELEDLLRMRNEAAGFRLHFGHVRYLLIVPEKEQRRNYALRAVEALWDPKQLHEKIKRAYGAREPHGPGHKCPGTIAAQIRQIMEVSRVWLAKQTTVWNGQEAGTSNVFANIMDAPADVFSEDDLENIQKAKEIMRAIAEEAAGNVARIDRIVEHMTACLAAQAAHTQQERAGAAAEADAGRERRSVDIRTRARRAVSRRPTMPVPE